MVRKNKYGQNMVTICPVDKFKAPDHIGQELQTIDVMRLLTFRELWSTTSSFEAVFLTFLNIDLGTVRFTVL
jgi:hypothetical protein